MVVPLNDNHIYIKIINIKIFNTRNKIFNKKLIKTRLKTKMIHERT